MKNINIRISIILHHLQVKYIYIFAEFIVVCQITKNRFFFVSHSNCFPLEIFFTFTSSKIKVYHHSWLLFWLQLSKISLQIIIHFSLACNDAVFLRTNTCLFWNGNVIDSSVFHPCTLDNQNSNSPFREILTNGHRCENIFIICLKPTQIHNLTKYM